MGWDHGERRQALEHVGRGEGKGGGEQHLLFETVAMGRNHGERRLAVEHVGRGEGRGRGNGTFY